jgi:hypothetical protein
MKRKGCLAAAEVRPFDGSRGRRMLPQNPEMGRRRAAGATGMSRTEAIVVGVFPGVACPLLTSVLFWWTAAAAGMCVLHVAERLIVTPTRTGLAIEPGLGGVSGAELVGALALVLFLAQ